MSLNGELEAVCLQPVASGWKNLRSGSCAAMSAENKRDPLIEELNRRGQKVVDELYGRDYDNVLALLKSLDERLVDSAVGYAYGNVYNSISLDARTRELVMVAVLAAMNYPDQMVTHLIAAQKAGATEDNIRDTLILIGTVAGIPCVIESLKRARKIFKKNAENSQEP
jgi:4-carboxymuconolactone decarboxylase